MNTHQSNGFFRQIRGRIQGLWGRLTGSRSQEIKGAVNRAAGSAQTGYGNVKDEARETLRSFQTSQDEKRRMTG